MHSVWTHWMHIEGHLICIQCVDLGTSNIHWHWMHIEGDLICFQCGRTGCILRDI